MSISPWTDGAGCQETAEGASRAEPGAGVDGTGLQVISSPQAIPKPINPENFTWPMVTSRWPDDRFRRGQAAANRLANGEAKDLQLQEISSIPRAEVEVLRTAYIQDSDRMLNVDV